MPARRILVLAALCAALGVIALASRPAALQLPPTVELPAFAELSRFEIARTGQPKVVLTRVGDAWRVGDAPADPHAIEAIAAALATPVALDPLATSDDLGRYALTDDALTVDFGDGARWLLGKVGGGRHTFARRPGASLVYRARANLRRAFDRPAAKWRQHTLFVGRVAADVARLEMRRGEVAAWAATRVDAEAEWRFEHPKSDDAGQAELHAVANTLATAKAERFASDTDFRAVTRLMATGFDGTRFGLDLGPREKDGSARVRRASDGVVAVLPNHLMTFLDVSASELRDRRVFRFADDDLLGIRFGDVTLERRDDAWWATRPRAVALNADAAKLLTDAVVYLRAAGFPQAPPAQAFDQPHGTLHLRLKDERTLTLTIGERYGDKARLARASDRPERVFALAEGMVERLLPTLGTLLSKPAFNP